MKKFLAIIFLTLGAVPQVACAQETQPICYDFSSDIEPDMQRKVSDFTKENYEAAQNALETTIRDWMENKFERNKKHPQTNSNLFEGEIWLAHANHSAMVKGYVLKLEYLSASADEVEPARQALCKFVIETPYFD